jgi:uncharacterized membrane protein YphA (DoxX/SURF4 family)
LGNMMNSYSTTHHGSTSAERAATLAIRPSLRWVAMLALCSAFIQGGLTKGLGFSNAVVEMHRFGLPHPAVFAAVAMTFELTGSILILTGYGRWAGALLLAAFTLAATLIVNRFWSVPPPGRLMQENSFFEHLGLIGGFLLVAWVDLKERLEHRAASTISAAVPFTDYRRPTL